MGRMPKIRRFRTIVYLFLIPFTLDAQETPKFKWPLELGTFPDLKGITSTFAESRADHYHSGVDISAVNVPVQSMASGKILYARDASDDPFQPTYGPGNHVIVDHSKGWWSGYYHLEKVIRKSGDIKQGEVLGTAGNTGHSVGAHLHFFVVSNYGKIYLNPLDILPTTTDKNPPIIGQLALVTTKGKTLISHSKRENIRLTKAYPIYLIASDPGLEPKTNRGLYRLRWKLNDAPEKDLKFEKIQFSKKDWLLQGKLSFPDTFLQSMYNLGELRWQNGTNTLTITAEDRNGNTTTKVFDINVNKEY